MTTIIGFNSAVADKAEHDKREGQRKDSARKSSKHIHFDRKCSPLSNPVLPKEYTL
jgi:hypothetical protein